MAQTTIACPRCGNPLQARRTCHQAYMYCQHCEKEFALRDVISRMDDALEAFLEAINCDRV